MTDSARAVQDLAAAIPVGEPPSGADLTRRARRRRRIRIASVAAAIALLALAAGLLASAGPQAGAGKAGRGQAHNQLTAYDVALAAGRHALTALGGPPVGSFGLIRSGQLWVLDGDGLFLTGDGGSSWKLIAVPGAGDPLANYEAIEFVSLRQGWIVVGRVNSLQVARTSDGGKEWSSVTLPASLFPRGWQGADVSFINRYDGWVVVQPYTPPGRQARSVVLYTTDGGVRWTVATAAAPVSSVIFSSATSGWGLGLGATSLYRTTDGGRSWQPVTLPRPAGTATGAWISLTLPEIAGGRAVLLAVPAAGDAITESTGDGGLTWVARQTPFRGEPVYPQAATGEGAVCADCVVPGDEPFAVLGPAQWRYWGGDRVYTTTDSGATWSSVQPNLSFAAVGGTLGRVGVDNEGSEPPLQFASPQTGWALASTSSANGQQSQSVLLVTNDGGKAFSAVPSPRG